MERDPSGHDEAVTSVLWLAREVSELYNVVWQLNTLFGRNSDNLQLAQNLVGNLLRRGLVRLFRAPFDTSHQDPIPDVEAPSVVASRDAWEPPAAASDSRVYLITTPEGEAALQQRSG